MEVDVNEERERKRVLIKLFSAAGVYERGAGFNTITILSQDSLPDFIHACRSEKVAIERLLEISLRRDLGNKASRQLGVFLGLVGLSLEKAGTKREPDGSKKYFYKVDAGKLARVQGEVDRRKDPGAKVEWATLQERRFPDDAAPDIEANRQLMGSGASPNDDEGDDLARAQRELDRKAERYSESLDDAPVEPNSELAKSGEGSSSLHLIDGLLQRSNPSLRLLGGLALAIVVVRLSTLRSESGTVDERLDDDLPRFAGNQGVYLPRRIGLGLVGLLADLLASGYRLFHGTRVDCLGRLRGRSLGLIADSVGFSLRLIGGHVLTFG
jgi:hypothetical protein